MKHLSNIIYQKAKELRYEDFVTWFDSRIDIEEEKNTENEQDEKRLEMFWSDDEDDIMVAYPRRCDGSLIQGHFFHEDMIFDLIKHNTATNSSGLPYNMRKSIVEELKTRDYDIKTLKFSIKLNAE